MLFVALATAGIVPVPACHGAGAGPGPARPGCVERQPADPGRARAATSKAWLVMDYATGQVLAGENIDTPVSRPASPR